MKNKKGFTLIELLAVIVILGILLSISIVAVNKIKGNQEEENRKNVISSILTGAKEYVADNRDTLNNLSATNNKYIKVSEIKNKDYVDFDETTYSDLLTEEVSISTCGDEMGVMLKYSLDNYNDCGCEKQVEGTSEKICKN